MPKFFPAPKHSIAKHSNKALGAVNDFKPVKVKQVMLLDTGDGAFVDQSVKVKQHKANPALLALKCTDRARLLDAVKRMGLAVVGMPVKGRKHYIVFVSKGSLGLALAQQSKQAALEAGEEIALEAFEVKGAIAGKGGAK